MDLDKVISFTAPDAGSKLDPNLFALMNNRNGNQDGQNWWWIIILMLFGWGRNGMGGFGGGNEGALPAGLQGDAGRELLMQGINGNRSALDTIAASLNTSTQNVQNAICGVNNSITQLSGQTGMSAQQIINSIQLGNQGLMQQLADCCCKTQNAITTQGYESRLAECQQTNSLTNTMNQNTLNLRDAGSANTKAMIDEFRSFRDLYTNDKMDALREKNSSLQSELDNARQTSMVGNMINSAIAPVATTLNSLYREVDAIKCKQLPTYPQQYVPGMATMSVQAPMCTGAYTAGYVAGEQNNGGIW